MAMEVNHLSSICYSKFYQQILHLDISLRALRVVGLSSNFQGGAKNFEPRKSKIYAFYSKNIGIMPKFSQQNPFLAFQILAQNHLLLLTADVP